MGIYSDGKVYGISLKLDHEIVFMKKYSYEMGNIEIQDVRDIYNTLTGEQKQHINVSFFTSCSTTYEVSENKSMTWFPGSINMLETLFSAK